MTRKIAAGGGRFGAPVVVVAAVVLFFLTRERVVGFDTRPLGVAVNAGSVTIAVNARMTGQNGWINQEYFASLKWWFWWRVSLKPPMAVVMVPLWVVAMSGVGATVWSWRAHGRRARGGAAACPGCGYDLRGTPGAVVCPECGAATYAGRGETGSA